MSLGDGYTGLHCVLLSALFIFEIFHSRKFLFSQYDPKVGRAPTPGLESMSKCVLDMRPDLRLTRLVPAPTLNLLCDVGQVTHHLWALVPQERRRSLNIMGSNHLPFSIYGTGHIYLACSGSPLEGSGFPHHSSKQPLQKGFCGQISWKDTSSQHHPCPGKSQATLAH